LLAPRPTPKLEGHPLSAVRDCLFNTFASTLHIVGRSSIHNLRTRHAVVTATHRSHCHHPYSPNKMYYIKTRFTSFSAMEEILIHKGQSMVLEFLSTISKIDAQTGFSRHQHVLRRLRSKTPASVTSQRNYLEKKCKSDVNRLRQ
jgi:hypothetical protein